VADEVFDALELDDRSVGFVALHRRIREHRKYGDPKWRFAFEDILLRVRYRGGYQTWCSGRSTEQVWVPRGAMLTSSRRLSRDWFDVLGWSHTTVWRFLMDCYEHGELIPPGTEHHLKDHSALLIVVNYDVYNPPPSGARRPSATRVQRPSYKNKDEQVTTREPEPVSVNAHDATVVPGADTATSSPSTAEIQCILDAYRGATGRTGWTPSEQELRCVESVLLADAGQAADIAQTVLVSTAAATERGQIVRTIKYGLEAWKNERSRQRKGEWGGASSSASVSPSYWDEVHFGHLEPVTDDQRERNMSHVRSIIEKLKR